MARISNKTRLLSAVSSLPNATAGQLADFLESVVAATGAEDIGEIETSVRSSRRKAKAEVAEKPARRTRRAKAEPEDEKPARRTRRAKAEVEDEGDEKPARRTRKPKAEALPEDVTVDDLYDILEKFEGEPLAGTLRDLKPEAEAYGLDVKAFLAEFEGTAKEKAEELGMFVAACKALEASIVASLKEDEDAMSEIIEELELDLSERARAGTIAKAIVVALHDEAEDGEDDSDDEEEEEEEEVAPRRSRRAKAEVAEKPARRSRRAKAEVEDEDDDLSDLDDLND